MSIIYKEMRKYRVTFLKMPKIMAKGQPTETIEQIYLTDSTDFEIIPPSGYGILVITEVFDTPIIIHNEKTLRKVN